MQIFSVDLIAIYKKIEIVSVYTFHILIMQNMKIDVKETEYISFCY